jgi:hypothetical protein
VNGQNTNKNINKNAKMENKINFKAIILWTQTKGHQRQSRCIKATIKDYAFSAIE